MSAPRSIVVGRVQRALAARPHREAPPEGRTRAAAVAAILRDGAAGAEVLLIRRATKEGDPWSGHMALPGGRRDPDDRDLLHTAIRETAEEVGLQLDAAASLLGRLDDLPAIARGRPVGMLIATFVFAIEGDPVLVPRAGEVQEALWAPLDPLHRGERDATHAYEFEGRHLALPAWDVGGRVVWGLTHRMLSALFEVVTPVA